MRKLVEVNTIKERMQERAFDIALNKVKRKFGFELYMSYPGKDKVKKLIYDFITRYDKFPQYHFENYNSNSVTSISINTSFTVMIDKHTFMYVATGTKVPEYDYTLAESREHSPIKIYFYIFGKNSYLHYMKLYTKYNKISDDPTVIESLSVKGIKDRDYFEVIASELAIRDLDTLFYEENIKERILDHIDNFKNNNSLLIDRGIKFKTSILLHGDPGTGKTSIVSSLAGYLKCDIVNIDISTIHMINIAKLAGSIDEATKTGNMMIILLEDIDTMMLDRESTEDKDYLAATQNLLQLLDSGISPNNVIFIATTNHIDKLDGAILRPGRLDLHLKVTGISQKNIVKMIKSFHIPEDRIDAVLDKINKDDSVVNKGLDIYKGDTIQQAIIQKYIIDEYIRINGISHDTLIDLANNNIEYNTVHYDLDKGFVQGSTKLEEESNEDSGLDYKEKYDAGELTGPKGDPNNKDIKNQIENVVQYCNENDMLLDELFKDDMDKINKYKELKEKKIKEFNSWMGDTIDDITKGFI